MDTNGNIHPGREVIFFQNRFVFDEELGKCILKYDTFGIT